MPQLRTIFRPGCALLRVALVFLMSLTPSAIVAQESSGEDQKEAQKKADVRVTKPPKLVKEVKAEYTDEAIENRAEGPVKLRLTIDANGSVEKVEVLEGLGYGLDEAAVEAAKQFEFEPAEINNQPAAVALTFTVNFSLPILPSAFEGEIVDAETGDGVVADISIEYAGEDYDPKPSASMTTEEDGEFSFENVPPGTYDVRIDLDRYRNFETDIELVPGETSAATYKVSAEPENVVGRVRESGTRKQLAGIRVVLLDQETAEPIREDYTAGTGRFAFRGVPPGDYTIRFEGDNYFTSSAGLEVVANEVTEGNFYIEAEYYDQYTVETKARRARKQVNRRRLELEEIRRVPGTGGDIVRVVQNMPGVARAPYVSGQVIVRGANPQDTRIYLQGDNIPLVYHFFGGPAVINSEMIDSLDFYPGNFSTYYGRATGGVIDLSSRSPKTDRFHGMAEVDLLDATALIEGPITDDLSFAISGRRSYFDAFLPILVEETGLDILVAPRYYDYQGWLTWTGFDNHKLELFVYGSDDRIELILDEDDPEGTAEVQVTGIDLVNSFIRGQFRWEYRPRLPIENTFMASFGVNTTSFEVAENFFFDVNLYVSQLREDLRLKLAEPLTLRLGADWQMGNARLKARTPRFTEEREDFNGDGEIRPDFGEDGFQLEEGSPQLYPAFYSELEITPIEKWLLVPGLRFDYFGPSKSASVSPRFSTRYQLNDEWTAKGGVGLFTQPTIPGTTNELVGNPDLTFEKAMHYSVGTEWKPNDFLEFDVTLFYRDMFDLLDTTSEFEVGPDGEQDPLIYNNEGEGRAYGAEFLIRHYPQNRFFGWVAYTLSRAERINEQTGEYDLFRYDQTHILTAVAGYNFPYNIDVSTRFRLVTGNPETPIVDGVYNSDQDEYIRVFGDRHSERNPTFHQLDVRVDKKFVFQSWILGFYLDVLNVYNAENPEGVEYNYDFSERAPVRGLPILPTLGVNARF